jgi:exodeoxyribonuclease VII large subunit
MAADNLVARTNAILEQKKYKLELTEKSVMSFSADAMLTRGFSITLSEGRIVRSVSDVRPGSRLETRFGDGTIQSITEIIHKNDE